MNEQTVRFNSEKTKLEETRKEIERKFESEKKLLETASTLILNGHLSTIKKLEELKDGLEKKIIENQKSSIKVLKEETERFNSQKIELEVENGNILASLPVFEGIKLENTSLLQRIDNLNQTIYRQSCKIERLEDKIETDETSMDEFNARRKAERVGKRKNIDENLTDCPICSQKGFKNVNIHIGHMHKCKQCRELFTECTCH